MERNASMTNEWTPQSVRDLLPDVTVEYPDGTRGTAMVSGRYEQFLTLRPLSDFRAGYSLGEVAAETVAHCLNEDRPVLV